MLKGDFLNNFFVRYSTVLHLPPLKFHCVRGCWDRTHGLLLYFRIDSQTFYNPNRLVVILNVDRVHFRTAIDLLCYNLLSLLQLLRKTLL